MAFTLRQIEIFIEAAKDGNFRKTADRLGISQPSISKHIQRLEEQAGGALFDRRRGSSARLSALGESLLQDAQSILSAASSVRSPPHPDGSARYLLRVAAGHYLHDQVLRPALRQLYARPNMPDVRLVSVEGRENVLALLRRGDADLGFYTGEPEPEDGFVTEALGPATVGLYGTPALAMRFRSALDQLDSAPIILPPAQSLAAEWQLNALACAGIRPKNISSRSQFIEVVIDQVVSGLGLALLFDTEIQHLVESGNLIRLPFDFTSGFRCMIVREQTAGDLRARAAIAFLRQAMG